MTEQDVIENKKGTRKVYAVVIAVVAAIVGLFNVIFWNVVEATVFEEVAKIVLMSLVIGVIVCGALYVPITILSDARLKYYPEYGKNWFKQAWKERFKKK